MYKQQTFKQLFSENELALTGEENLKKLGLTKHEALGRVYYVFEGTPRMLRELPIVSTAA